MLVVAGALHPNPGEGAFRELGGDSLAHLFLTVSCGAAALRLLRDVGRSSAHVALAAGALVFMTLYRLAHLVVDGDLSEVSLSVRTEILANAAGLAIGIWAFSYALRLQRRDRAA